MMVLLCHGAMAFLVPSAAKPRARHFMGPREDTNENMKERFLDLLRKIVTGSPDGIMLIGKPQIDWSTGKPYTKRSSDQQYEWGASPKKAKKILAKDASKGK